MKKREPIGCSELLISLLLNCKFEVTKRFYSSLPVRLAAGTDLKMKVADANRKKSLCVLVCVCVVVLCPAAPDELWEPFRLCGKPLLQVANRFLIWEPALFVEAVEWAEFKRTGMGRLGGPMGRRTSKRAPGWVCPSRSETFGAVEEDLSSGWKIRGSVFRKGF